MAEQKVNERERAARGRPGAHAGRARGTKPRLRSGTGSVDQLFSDGARAGGAARVRNCHRTVNSDGGAWRTGERADSVTKRSAASSSAQQSGIWHSAGEGTTSLTAESL